MQKILALLRDAEEQEGEQVRKSSPWCPCPSPGTPILPLLGAGTPAAS
jgi:hypothetical protein